VSSPDMESNDIVGIRYARHLWQSAVATPAIIDRAASIRLGAVNVASTLPEAFGNSEEINIVLAPARTPNSMSESLSPITTER
jgi:hypothetical protein